MGNGHQRVMGIIIVTARKEGLIGGNQWNIMIISERDHPAFMHTVITLVALQFDIKPISEQRFERLKPRQRLRLMTVLHRQIDRTACCTRQGDQAIRADLFQPGGGDMHRLRIIALR